LLNCIEADPVVAQVEHEWQALACLSDTLNVSHDAARGDERIRRLVDHEGGCARLLGSAGECTRISDAASNTSQKRRPAGHMLRSRVHHPLGFRRGQSIKFSRITVRDQDVNARLDCAIDNRLEAQWRYFVIAIKRCDQDAGNASQCLSKTCVDCCHGNLLRRISVGAYWSRDQATFDS